MRFQEADWQEQLTALLVDHPKAFVLGLQGPLGAGKTTLTRQLVQMLRPGAKTRVTSPTFTLHQSYPDLERRVEHFDLYRFDTVDAGTLESIGYWDAWERAQDSNGIVVVEWPERANPMGLLRLDTLWRLEILDATTRSLKRYEKVRRTF